jgi:hypothetical protein
MTFNLHVNMVQQGIKHPQVHRLHLDLREGGDLLGRLHGGLDGRVRDRRGARLRVAAEGRPQGVLHASLAFPRRQLQDLQVLPHGAFVRVLPAERVVGHAKVARGEQVFVVLVVGEGARLANQRVDDVAVIDGMLADARQPRHALHQHVRVPHLHLLHANHHIHLVANQTAVDRVGVPQNLDRAAHAHADLAQPPRAFQPPPRQRPDRSQLFQKALLPLLIARGHQLLEKPHVLLTIGEVAAAPQPQGLVHRVLEVPVRRFRVAVLVRPADVDPLPLQAIVLQELAIPLVEFSLLGQVVHRRRETVAAMPPGNAPQFPQGVLQALAEGLKRLRRAERDRFPIRVRQREVIRQVCERLAAERHSQRFHVGEVRGPQVARMMDLREHHLLPRPLGGPPETHLALKAAPLAVGELPCGLALQPAKQRHRPQRGFLLKPLLDLRPDRDEGIAAGSPPTRSHALRRQLLKLPIFTRRLLVHVRSPGRQGQLFSRGQQPKQLPHLTILDHRNLLFLKGLRLCTRSTKPGILIRQR